jgi:hypothetical protein
LGELKSSYELAMEKLRARGGEDDVAKLNDEQKTEIAELRSQYRAKLAEKELATQDALRKLSLSDPAEYLAQRERLEQELLEQRQRLEAELERKLEAVRNRSASEM